jgi:hypothetical protein
MRAIVVFSGDNTHPLAFLLRRGFKHCFVCLVIDNWWLLVDGSTGVPVIKPLTGSDFDLAAFYRDQGMTVIEATQGARPSFGPLAWNTCVGLTKAVLAINSWAVSPHQLYRHLSKGRA